MGQTKYLDREIPTISLANFDSRIDEITRELVEAAEHVGFFCIVSCSPSIHFSAAPEVSCQSKEMTMVTNREDGPLIVFKRKSSS
jgi:isopenicillin N synthase-like dioxygenase